MGSVLDVAFTKIVLHHRGPRLRDPKVRTNVVHHFLYVNGTDAAECVALHILFQQFIRVQLRAVRGQKENSDLCSMLIQPAPHRSGLVDGVTVGNQKYFSLRLSRQPQQTTKKIQKHPRRETLTENHESQPPPIGDGRDHVAAKALTGAKYHRRLSASSVGSSRLMVRTQPHLIQPMNLRLKLSRQFSNRWIFFLQPFPHRGRILFIRSAHRLLRGQTPGAQIASHRPHRNLQIKFSRQQLLHRFSGPQRKGQAQLVRTTADNVAHRRSCLMRCQSRNRRSSPPVCFQRPSSFPFHHPHPAAHCTASYPEDSSHLSLRKTFLNCLHDSSAKIFLSFRRQRASILVSHARHTNTLFSECHLYYAPISKGKL